MSDVNLELDSESGYSRELETFLPVGDIICRNEPELRRVKTGVVPRECLTEFLALCVDWEANGFKLYLGGRDAVNSALMINSYIPDILQDEFDTAMAITCSPQSAHPLIGDIRAFFMVTDAKKALAFLKSRTDIPCAVVWTFPVDDADMMEAITTANDYFAYYWEFREPKRLGAMTEAEILTAMAKDL